MIHAPATLARLAIAHDGRGWRFARQMGPDPARVFLGRPPQEAAQLAPLVFNLCGAAHALAAAAALGLSDRLDTAALARRMAQETARDHVRAILVDWPIALGAAPDRASLSLMARPDGADALVWALVGDGGDLAAFSVSELEAWLDGGASGTARLLSRIRREVDAREGRAALPELTAEDLVGALRLEAPAHPLDEAGSEAAGSPAPCLARETGALSRMARTQLLSALLAQEGPSLFVRLLARLLDAVATLRGVPPSRATPPPGTGLASAARGLLGHGARVEDGRVTAYRVLSPSVWNLAPGGLLERAFAALSPRADAARLAPLLISAINPCVPVALSLTEAAHA